MTNIQDYIDGYNNRIAQMAVQHANEMVGLQIQMHRVTNERNDLLRTVAQLQEQLNTGSDNVQS